MSSKKEERKREQEKKRISVRWTHVLFAKVAIVDNKYVSREFRLKGKLKECLGERDEKLLDVNHNRGQSTTVRQQHATFLDHTVLILTWQG